MRSGEAKYRTAMLLHRAQKRGLVLKKMENANVSVGSTRKQLVSYLFVDVVEKLDAVEKKRIETIWLDWSVAGKNPSLFSRK
jgi:hypothetical protein